MCSRTRCRAGRPRSVARRWRRSSRRSSRRTARAAGRRAPRGSLGATWATWGLVRRQGVQRRSWPERGGRSGVLKSSEPWESVGGPVYLLSSTIEQMLAFRNEGDPHHSARSPRSLPACSATGVGSRAGRRLGSTCGERRHPMTDSGPRTTNGAGATAATTSSTTSAATVTPPGKAVVVEEPTIGRLVADASRDVSALVQNEIALAKAELKVSVRAGGVSIGLFAAAAFILVLGVIMLSVAI